MAQLPGTFNPDDHEETGDFSPLPAGDYLAQVIESAIEPTQSGGEMLKLTFEVMDGQYERRRLWARLNIVNHSADAQRIAQAQLASLCRAAGCGPIDDTEALHFKPVVVKVAVRKDPKYGEQNDVKGFKTADPPPSSPPPRPQAARPASTQSPQRPPASTPPPATRPAGSRPWGNRAAG